MYISNVGRFIWRANGRFLVLIAIPKPKRIEEAINEIGDSLFTEDEDILVRRCKPKYTVICVYSSSLSPSRAFNLVISSPPAFLERIVPAHYHFYVTYTDIVFFFSKIISSEDLLKFHKVVGIELHIRSKIREEKVSRIVRRILKSNGLQIRYRARLYLVIETVNHMGIVGILERKHDRMSFWREKKLRDTFA